MSLAEDIKARLIVEQVNLLRFDEREARTLRKRYIELESELTSLLAAYDPTGSRYTTVRQRRLQKMLEDARVILRKVYRDLRRKQIQRNALFALEQSRSVARELNILLGENVIATIPSQQTMLSLSRDLLIEGAASSDWWQTQERALQDRFERAMRRGVMVGETLPQLIDRIRGTRANNFSDGIMKISANQARNLIRSSLTGVVNEGRLELYRQNSDVISRIQWSAVLDSRTTEICIALNGLTWTNPDGENYRKTTEVLVADTTAESVEGGKVDEKGKREGTGPAKEGDQRITSPPVREDEKIELYHWSRKEGLTELDPAFQGTGIRGAEKKRRDAYPDLYVPRTYFGIAPGQKGGYRKETGLGSNQYVVTIPQDRLYDIQSDPDNLMDLADKKVSPSFRGQWLSALEGIVKEKGYAGYWIDSGGGMGLTAAVFEKTTPETGFDLALVENPGLFATVAALQSRGVKGDRLLNIKDTINELLGVGARINTDGTVRGYHFTSPENVRAILEEGEMFGKEPSIFFSTSPDSEYGSGFGESFVTADIPLEDLSIDDIFPGTDASISIGDGKLPLGKRVGIKVIEEKETIEPFDVRGYIPVGHNQPFPGPVAHWGERSTQVPIVAAFDELTPAVKRKLDRGLRPTQFGEIPTDAIGLEWLRQQDKATQIAILGVQKQKLFAAGEIDSIRDLVDQSNRPLTLRSLRKRLGEQEPLAMGNVDKSEIIAKQLGLTLPEMYALATSNRQEMMDLVAGLERDGVVGKVAKLKTRSRSLEKIGADYGGEFGRLTDIVRGGFTLDSFTDSDVIFNALSARFPAVYDKGWRATPMGYADRLMLVQFENGLVGELQFWSPFMFDAKDQGGHQFYDQWRMLDEQGVDPTDPRMEALVRQSLEFYEREVWSKLDETWDFVKELVNAGALP